MPTQIRTINFIHLHAQLEAEPPPTHTIQLVSSLYLSQEGSGYILRLVQCS